MNFDAAVIAAVTGHMNADHNDDNLLIARAFGHPSATQATMTTLDSRGGTWAVTDADGEHALTVAWPAGEVTERPQIRREVVMLYRAACDALGLPARDEHAPASVSAPAADAHVHAHAAAAPVHAHAADAPVHAHAADAPVHAHAADAHAAAEAPSFARRMRESTWSDHEDSEGAEFMANLLRGRGSEDDYTQLVAQHWFMHDALEDAARQLAADPALAPLHPPTLLRRGALERDLTRLLGAQWRERTRPVPATDAYAQRIREIAERGWTAGIIAHHYTRYLGDLAGGQTIARRMAAQFHLDGEGVAFYDFTALGDVATFRADYRAVLDAFGGALDEGEQERMLDEVRAAYGFNTAVFVDLERARTTG